MISRKRPRWETSNATIHVEPNRLLIEIEPHGGEEGSVQVELCGHALRRLQEALNAFHSKRGGEGAGV